MLKKNSTIIPLFIILLIVLSSSLFFLLNLFNKSIIEGFLSTLNVIFSGIAVIGLVISYRLQQKEQKEQRKEFTFDRLTNILFRQIDKPNEIIDKVNFYSNSNKSSESKIEFNTFIKNGNKLKNIRYDRTISTAERQEIIRELHSTIKVNSTALNDTILGVWSIYNNYNNLLINSILEEKEINELKFLLKNNLSDKWNSLISVWLDYARRERNYKHKELNQLENIEKKAKINPSPSFNTPLVKVKIMNIKNTIIAIDSLIEKIVFIGNY